jgi:ATP-binding cassette subfamily B protein/ATP-binding cassette subfamily C protein/ATP-binding cassette subfamily B multidrug efflux pump
MGFVTHRLSGTSLLRELALLVAAGIVVYFLRVGWRLKLYAAAYRLGVELRDRLLTRLALQGPHFYQGQRTGNLMALATNDIDAVEMAAGEAMLAGFDGTLTLVLVVAMMSLGVDWRLASFALLPFPFMALSFWWISRHVHDASRLSLERFGALNDHVQESLSGVRTIRALGLQAQSEAQFSGLATGVSQASFDAYRWEATYEPAVGFTLAAATAITLGYGGWLVWQDQLTVGQLTSFSLYLGQLIWPMFAAGWILSLLQRGKAAWGRLQPILERPLSVDDHGREPRGRPPAHRSARRAVSAYPGQPRPALHGLSFRLEPGTHARFGRTDGRGQIDAAEAFAATPCASRRHAEMERLDLQDYTLDALRGAIAWVPQEPFLFSASVAENIALARPQASRDRLSKPPGWQRYTRTSCICRRATTLR